MKTNEIKISLKAARVNKEMSQERVAKMLNVTRQTIINWENGKTVPGIPELTMLSSIYEIPQDYIFLPCYSTKSKHIREDHT